ncbi:MAG: LpxD N-terminal domain-containing protein, partial [Comamonadaceae bacterium]|nr:LpxD N-terminal domain-containing protein [Comamonadaceae bacterium]
MSLRLAAIVEALGGELHGDADRVVERLAPLESAGPEALSFLVPNPRLAGLLARTGAGCVIVAPAMREAAQARGDCIVTPDPYLYFARLTQLWKKEHGPFLAPGIHPSAVVEEDASIDPTAHVGALCFVGRGARIGA